MDYEFECDSLIVKKIVKTKIYLPIMIKGWLNMTAIDGW